MTHASLLKQDCLGCQKTILLHSTIITCAVCSAMSHSECAKLAFEFNVIKLHGCVMNAKAINK